MKKSISPTIETLLTEGKIIEAIGMLYPRVASIISHPEYAAKLHGLRDTYERLLDFFSKGYPDPGRNDMIEAIGNSIRDLAGAVDFESKVLENEGFYYAQVRADRLSHEHLAKLLESYFSLDNMLSISNDDSESSMKLRIKRDDYLERSFNKAMILHSQDDGQDIALLVEMINSDEYPLNSRLQMVSALILDVMAGYDREIVSALLEIYERNGNLRIQAKALCGVFLALHLYSSNISHSKELMNRLDLMSDSILTYSHLREVVLTMIRTRDTGRINDQFKREVLDNFKDFKGKVKMPDAEMLRPDMNGEDLELNPEWQEFLEKSGIEKKLRKFSELQSEGADLMMITFAQLKNFSFFRNVANWFLPFDPGHSSLEHYREMRTDALDSFMNLPGVMCDSDKYSLALSLSQMPAAQRLMLSSQLEAQQEQLNAETSSARLATSNPEFSNEVLMTMRSLYRFTRLFNGVGKCFHDPFEKPVDITTIPALQELLGEEEVLQLVSEFYFKHGYYGDALKLFLIMEKRNGLNMYLAEKTGYCFEKLLDYSQAYAYYCKAELLGASSKWLWKRMLTILTDSDPMLALQYAERLYESDTNSLKNRLDYINALKITNQDEKLIKILYQCFYENPETPATTLLLARTLLNRGEIEKAGDILESFNLPSNAVDTDRNEYHGLKGTLCLIDGNIPESMSHFKELGEKQTLAELQKLNKPEIDEHTKRLILELLRK